MDRLPVLQHTLQHWEGPVSLVVHVPIKPGQPDDDWQKLYIQKKLQILKLHPDSHVTLAYESAAYGDYPINALRNLAIRQTNCEFLLLADADFQPSPDFHKHFLLATRSLSGADKTAFVVPAFEYIDTPQKSDGVPQSKDELMQLLHRQDPFVQPFRQDVTPDSHRMTDYWKWYRTDRPYQVSSFSDKYEPYVVLKNTVQLPMFDERFSGYGMNKITHVTELFAAGYTFYVLPDVWLIHVPHKPSAYFVDHVQNPQHRLRNRVQRFEFLVEVLRRYGLGSCGTRTLVSH
uniref:Putative transferase transferring glycosyl groups n=2 Tax=Ornithodoros turicata TaxID=34597 RepID=A0A2R5LLI6_9ACAR